MAQSAFMSMPGILESRRTELSDAGQAGGGKWRLFLNYEQGGRMEGLWAGGGPLDRHRRSPRLGRASPQFSRTPSSLLLLCIDTPPNALVPVIGG